MTQLQKFTISGYTCTVEKVSPNILSVPCNNPWIIITDYKISCDGYMPNQLITICNAQKTAAIYLKIDPSFINCQYSQELNTQSTMIVSIIDTSYQNSESQQTSLRGESQNYEESHGHLAFNQILGEYYQAFDNE